MEGTEENAPRMWNSIQLDPPKATNIIKITGDRIPIKDGITIISELEVYAINGKINDGITIMVRLMTG